MSNSLRHEANSLFGDVERLDPALDALIDSAARVEEVCAGFVWSEGPVWKDAALFFSDVPAMAILLLLLDLGVLHALLVTRGGLPQAMKWG